MSKFNPEEFKWFELSKKGVSKVNVEYYCSSCKYHKLNKSQSDKLICVSCKNGSNYRSTNSGFRLKSLINAIVKSVKGVK